MISNAASVNAILPILIIMVTGMIVLVGDACLPIWRRMTVLSGNVSLIGIGLAALFAVRQLNAGDVATSAFHGAVAVDGNPKVLVSLLA